MDWADLSINTLAPWSLLGLVVLTIFRAIIGGKLLPIAAVKEREGLMRDRLADKDQQITAGLAREDILGDANRELSLQVSKLLDGMETIEHIVRSLPRGDSDGR